MKNLKDIDNDYTLIIIGDGSLKDKITEKINKYKLENNVIMIDKVKNSEIHKYYKASDIFINFNENEIFGMSILEAMNQECKVIAASAPGPRSIIDNKVNGILIDNSSVDVWIKAIEDNINNKTMGIEARKTIKEHLNWDNIAEKYIKLFEELVGE